MSLYIAGEKRGGTAVEEINRIYLAWWSGTPFVAVDDDPFLVVVARDEAWVVPDTTAGVKDLLFGPCFELLVAAAKFYKAWAPPMPLRWRKKWWTSEACLGVHSAHSVPSAWQSKPSLTREEIRSNALWGHYGRFRYQGLDTLIGGWFHQDYDIDGDSLEEIVGSYKKVYPVEDWRSTKADIEQFLRERNDNQVKEDFVRLFQPGVDPEAWGMSTRQWLLRLADLLRR